MAFDDGVKTVSGSIAHTYDAAAKVPFVSLKCGIAPTLTGKSAIECTQTGKNLFDKTAITPNTWIVVNSTETESTVGYSTSDYIRVEQGKRYYVSLKISNRSAYYDMNKNGIAYFSFNGNASFTALYDGYVRITINNNIDLNSFMFNEGSTAEPYEPYNGTTYTASLGRTIYGGTADVVNGTGQETYIKYVIDGVNVFGYLTGSNNMNIMPYGLNIDGTISKWLCDAITASGTNFGYNSSQGFIFIRQAGWSSLSGVTDAETFNAYCQENPITLILPLATPTDFTFTPITPTPETVGKVNNVYCNTGNTELTYYDNAHGFSEVTVNKTGKNVLSSAVAETKVDHEISVECDGNGKYTLSGTATGGSAFVRFKLAQPVRIANGMYLQLKNNTWHASSSIVFDGEDQNKVFELAPAPVDRVYSLSNYVGKEIHYIRFYVVNGNTIDLNISPMFCFESSSMDYVPYEVPTIKTAYLHKVIYGGQADVVRGTCEPKNLLANLGTFPYSSSATAYYFDFTTKVQARKIPTFRLQADTNYSLSMDVECDNEPFNISVGCGKDGSYQKDIKTTYSHSSGRCSISFSVSQDFIDSNGDIFAFRVPRYGGSTQTFNVTIDNVQLEIGDTASEYAPHFDPFTFPPISMETDEGENTLFANEGDSAITYRKAVD